MTTALERPPGRSYFWFGLLACLIGIPIVFVQFALKVIATPWYLPALATVGTVLLLVAVAHRRTTARVVVFGLAALLTACEWYFLISLMKLPDYAGPAKGSPFPAFQAAQADGTPFSADDLRDGSRRAMVFFRGRW